MSPPVEHLPNTPHTNLFRLAQSPVKVDVGNSLVTVSNVTLIPARQFVIIDADTTAEIPLPKPPLAKFPAQVEQRANGYAETLKYVRRTADTNSDAAAPINIA